MLFLNTSEIFSHFVNMRIVFMNNLLILIKLINIFGHYFFNISFHSINLMIQLRNFACQFSIFSLFLLIILFSLTNLGLQICFFIYQLFIFIFKFFTLLFHIFKSSLLLLVETFKDKILLSLCSFMNI